MRTARALALVVAGVAAPAGADELVLRNGERLSGTVVSLSRGMLSFHSEILGSVTVSWKDVASLVSDTPVEVERSDERLVEGTLAPAAPGEIAVREPSGAVHALAMSETRSIAAPPKRWKAELSAGVDFRRGNSERSAAAANARVVRRTEDDRLTLSAGYGSSRESTADGEEVTTRAEILGAGQYDYFFTKRLYGLANVSGERDRVEGVDYRVISGVGLGYQILDTENLAVGIEAGPSYVYEDFDDGTKNDYLAARIAWNVEAVLVPNVSAFHRAQLLPSVSSLGDFLAKTQTGLRAKLVGGLFGEAKLLWDYTSSPSDDRERQDVTYQLGVGWGF